MRGIIFDLDGTLLDSMPMWTALDTRMLRIHGIEPPPDISETVKNMTVTEAAAYYAERFLRDMTPEQIMEECEQLAAEEYRMRLPLKPGAEEFLRALSEQGIPFGLASVTYRRLLESALERHRIRHLFRFILTPDDGFCGKERPDLFLRGAELLSAAPEDCAVIEDAFYAADTAKKAGFYTIGVYDKAAEPEWGAMSAVCDRTVQSLAELNTPAFFSQFHDGR
ncbi:MAG: HAD family phosphatase [Oscillospiraceae bacterium]|nr:HAD family phosphatase [Oscillospiraceae bacterium]